MELVLVVGEVMVMTGAWAKLCCLVGKGGGGPDEDVEKMDLRVEALLFLRLNERKSPLPVDVDGDGAGEADFLGAEGRNLDKDSGRCACASLA